MPLLRIRDNTELKQNEYRISVYDDIVPSKISYLQIKEELKKRVEEGKSIRNLIGIFEDMEKNM